MRILFVTAHVLSGEIGSGGEIVWTELARRWQACGHEVSLLVPETAAAAYAAAVHPASVVLLPHSWLDDPRWYFGHPLRIAIVYLLRSLRVPRLLGHVGAEIFYTPGDFWCDVLPTALFRRRSPSVLWAAAVFHVNASPLFRRGNSLGASILSFLAQRASFVLLKRFADVIFALNTDVRAALLRRGFTPERVRVLGAGVDTQKFSAAPQWPKQYAACFLGRINPTKGVFDLPEIWAQVKRVLPDRRLLIIGKASAAWERQLAAAIRDTGVADLVEYRGFVSPAEVVAGLASSSLLLAPSTEEGFGISIAEAMACGLPVVAYDLPAYREFFPQGMTRVPVGDRRAFAAAIIRLLTDKTFYREQCQAAVATVARYDWDRVAAKEFDIIKRARVGEKAMW